MLFMQFQYVHINLQKLQFLNNESFDVYKLKYLMNKIFHLYLSSKSKAQMLWVKKISTYLNTLQWNEKHINWPNLNLHSAIVASASTMSRE
jgi:hypothetical protein